MLRHLSSDARTLLQAASAVLETSDDDPVYDVADDIPIKPEQLLDNRAPRADTVVVKPPDRKTVVVPSVASRLFIPGGGVEERIGVRGVVEAAALGCVPVVCCELLFLRC